MTSFNDVARASDIVKRIDILTKELSVLTNDNPNLGEYVSSVVNAITDSVNTLNDRLELTLISSLLENVNGAIQPNFKLDIDAVNRKISLESNPAIYRKEDNSSADINIVVQSSNNLVSNMLMLMIATLTGDEVIITQLNRLISNWYPIPVVEEPSEETTLDTFNDEQIDIEESHSTPLLYEEEKVEEAEVVEDNDDLDIGTLANQNYRESVDEYKKDEIEKTNEPQTTKEETADPLVNGEEDSKFRDFVVKYLNDHNTLREFKTLKMLVEKEVHNKELTREEVIEKVTEIATAGGMSKEDYTSKLLLELATEVIARNSVLEGKYSFLPKKEVDDTNDKPIIINADIQPLLTYLILSYDILNRNLAGDRNLLEVVYHMFEFDKYKNILSSQSNITDFYSAVRTVTAIFSRHNWKLNFHQNTLEIQNPLLPMDSWTKEIKDIDGIINRIVKDVRSETNLEKVVKLRDIKHTDYVMAEIAQLSLDSASEFNDKAKDFVAELVSNKISIAITTKETGDLTDKESVTLINRENNRALLLLPNNVYVMTINNNEVNSITTLGQYDLTKLYEWLTYFELNYRG